MTITNNIKTLCKHWNSKHSTGIVREYRTTYYEQIKKAVKDPDFYKTAGYSSQDRLLFAWASWFISNRPRALVGYLFSEQEIDTIKNCIIKMINRSKT